MKNTYLLSIQRILYCKKKKKKKKKKRKKKKKKRVCIATIDQSQFTSSACDRTLECMRSHLIFHMPINFLRKAAEAQA
eukprot:SAG31_NODE_2397_length_5784_cov_5.338962_3_plen_78_part_00